MGIITSGLLIAIIAHGLIGISLVWDKILLRQPQTKNLVSYVFWLGAMSVFGVILVAFGFRMPTWPIAGLAFGTGALQLVAIYFYYSALKHGEASQTLAVMGGFSPLATVLIGIPLLRHPFTRNSLLGFALLVFGGFVMFSSERVDLRRMIMRILLASGLFGLVNVLEKVVFDNTNFVSGFTIFTVGTFAGAMFLLTRASWRRQVFENIGEAKPRSRFGYFSNRFISGVGSFLVYYAISLENPAVVDAISGVRYVIIFLAAYLLTKFKPTWLCEEFAGWNLAAKSVATMLVVAGLVILGLRGGETGGGGTSARLQRQQDYAAYHQQRPRPALPSYMLFQQVFGQRRFQ